MSTLLEGLICRESSIMVGGLYLNLFLSSFPLKFIEAELPCDIVHGLNNSFMVSLKVKTY